MARILIQRMTLRAAAPVVLDNAVVLAAAAIGTWAVSGTTLAASLTDTGFLARATFLALGIHLCLYYADLYDGTTLTDAQDLLVRTLRSIGATALLMALLYLVFPATVVGSGIAVLTLGLVVVPALAWRLGFLWFGDRIGPRERLLILGTPPSTSRTSSSPGGAKRVSTWWASSNPRRRNPARSCPRPASSAPSTTFRAWCTGAASIVSSSVSRMPAGACRWTRCSR
jgi:hypothetical protein